MILTIFLPLLIILIIIALRFLYEKRMPWLIGIYSIILLIAAGVYMFLPKQDHVYSKQMEQSGYPNLVELVYEGKSLARADLYIQNQWEFPYEQEQLQIVGHYDRYPDFETLIGVERKAEEDGIVEVIHYQTPVMLNGVDVTTLLNPIDVDLTPTGLEVTGIEYVELKLSTYRNDFPTKQFSQENWWVDLDYTDSSQVLLLRIPQNLELIDVYENLNIYDGEE